MKERRLTSTDAMVRQTDEHQIAESLDLLFNCQEITIKELMAFRERVEGIFAAVAANRAKKRDIREMGFLLKAMEESLLSGDRQRWKQLFRLDREFHWILTRTAGNPKYASDLTTVYDNIRRRSMNSISQDSKSLKETYNELRGIFDAIKKKDAEGSKRRMQSHIRRHSLKMETLG